MEHNRISNKSLIQGWVSIWRTTARQTDIQWERDADRVSYTNPIVCLSPFPKLQRHLHATQRCPTHVPKNIGAMLKRPECWRKRETSAGHLPILHDIRLRHRPTGSCHDRWRWRMSAKEKKNKAADEKEAKKKKEKHQWNAWLYPNVIIHSAFDILAFFSFWAQ